MGYLNSTFKIFFPYDAHIGQGGVEGNDKVDSRELFLALLVTASFTYHNSDPSVPPRVGTVRLLIEVSDLIDTL